VINHSFLIPGLVSTTLAVAVDLLIGSIILPGFVAATERRTFIPQLA